MATSTLPAQDFGASAERLTRNLAALRGRVARACEASGRDPDQVSMVAVTKYVGPAAIAALVGLGQRDLAENYVQWAESKQDALADLAASARWHLIGPLQTNKARRAVARFDSIQTVDRPKLVGALSAAAVAAQVERRVYLQPKLTTEDSKSGCPPEALDALADEVLAAPGLRLAGLLAIGPLADDPEASAPAFAQGRALHARLVERAGGALALSMGMSHDLEVAIRHGATELRIGSALFDGLPAWHPPGGGA